MRPTNDGMGSHLRLSGLLLGALTVLACGSARAETLSLSPHTGTLALGTIVAASPATSFHVDANSGLITNTGGTGFVLTTSTVATPTVTLQCVQTPGNCKGAYKIVFTNGASAGRPASITAFNTANVSVTSGVTATATSGSSPLTFNINSTANNWTVSFKLGVDVTFSSSATTGNTSVTYSIAATGP